jgi:hypothetical protein
MELRARSAQKKYQVLQRLGALSSLVEVYDSNGKPLDPLRPLNHAFKHGVMAGSKVIDLVHNGLVGLPVAIDNLHAIVTPQEELDSIHREYIIGSQLVIRGEQGLERISARALEDIERWERDVVSDVRAQRMFRLGCGAIIHSAYVLHNAWNEELIKNEIGSTDFDMELDIILPSDTSEKD